MVVAVLRMLRWRQPALGMLWWRQPTLSHYPPVSQPEPALWPIGSHTIMAARDDRSSSHKTPKQLTHLLVASSWSMTWPTPGRTFAAQVGHGLSTHPSWPNSRRRGSLTLRTAFVLRAYCGRIAGIVRA